MAEDNEPVGRAEQALQLALEHAYPQVTRWQIAPEALSSDVDASAGIPRDSVVSVTRVGARSAVWVGSAGMSAHRQGRLLWFAVAGYAPALVAAHTLAAAEPLDAGDGAMADSDIVAADCASPASAEALPGMRVKRTLHAGEVLCANLLEPVPPVTRGEEVTLLYRGRSFMLTARGVAQADGQLGKPVMVRNSSSGDVFTGTVSGRAEVSVNE